MPTTSTTTNGRYVFDLTTGNMALAFDGTGAMTDGFRLGPGTNQLLADEHFTPTTAGEMPGSAGTVYWALANGQGHVADVVNSSGTVENHTAYDPFGNVISGLSSSTANFLFGDSGEFADSAMGKVFAQNRVYDPTIDRWDRPDPTGLLPGPNPFEYCGNDPTNLTDPSGRFAIVAGGIAFVVYFFWPNTANAPGPGDQTVSGDPNAGLLPAAAAASGTAAGLAFADAVNQALEESYLARSSANEINQRIGDIQRSRLNDWLGLGKKGAENACAEAPANISNFALRRIRNWQIARLPMG